MDSNPVEESERLDDEPADAFALFTLYALLPPHRRDLVPLAEITGTDLDDVTGWARRYRWQERADARDAAYYARQEARRRHILDLLRAGRSRRL